MGRKKGFTSGTFMLLAGASLLGCVAVRAVPAYAQAAPSSFDINTQAAPDAIALLIKQGGVHVVYDYDKLRNIRTRPVKGVMPASVALRTMLEGTSFDVVETQDGNLAIRARKTSEAQRDSDELAERVSVAESGGDEREIVVTGSIIQGAVPSGSNLIVLRRKDLDNTGRGSLAEAIQTVPQVHGGGANEATTRTGSGAAPNTLSLAGYGASSLNLRGLGVEETLTLVNGRRLAPAGNNGAIADIAALPMAAVERVEILADGASATYGADAMAGVVNIIMNRGFEGAETRLRTGLETRSGQPEFQASQTFGWAFDRGNILLSADYARQDGVTAKGRPYAASSDLRPFGGSDHRLSACSPGNIVDTPGLNGAIPAGQDGTALTPDQIRRGEINRCVSYPESSHLRPETEKGSLYLTGSYDLTDRLRVSADIMAGRRHTTTIGTYSAGYLMVPTSNAFRQMNGLHGNAAPLDQSVYVTYQFTEVGPETIIDRVWSLLASVGADYRLGGDWQLSLYGTYSRNDSKTKVRELDGRRLEQALASGDPATALNPFGDGRTNSRELVESFFYPVHQLQESDYRSATLSLSGSLLDLPGGAVKLAVGGDYRQETLGTRTRKFHPGLSEAYQDSSIFDQGRHVKATYTEVFIPLFSEQNTVTGLRRLNVSLSGRYDHYSDFGSTFNPKAGVTWVPVEGLTLKGTYGTSFKAPLLKNLYGNRLVQFTTDSGSAGGPDINGDGSTTTMLISGSNPDLSPEKGKSWTVSAEIEPAMLQGLRLHASYFKLRFTGRFARIFDQSLVFANPAAFQGIAYFPLPLQSQVDKQLASADRVIGAVPPAGSIEAIIDQRTMNFASQVMDGVDAGASYHWDALGGTIRLSGDVSYLSRYKSRLGQSVAVTSYLGNVGLPARWKARGGLGWSGDGVTLNGWVNHTASYTNKRVEPHEPVSAYTTVDLSLQARLGGWARGLVGDGASLAFYVTNLFDQAPPFVNNPIGIGYDGANADPIGRRIAMQLTKRW